MEWERSYTDRQLLMVLGITSCRNVFIAQTKSGFLIGGSDYKRYGPVRLLNNNESLLCAYRFKSIKPLKIKL